MLQNNVKLKSLVVGLWDTLWSTGIANPITAIEQITYLLFIKRLDELEAARELEAASNKKNYHSKFTGTYIPYVDEKKFKVGKFKAQYNFENRDDLNRALEKAKIPRPKTELRWSVFKDFPAEQLLEHFKHNVFPFIKELNGIISPFTKHMENASFIVEKPSLLIEAIKKIDDIYDEIEDDASDGKQAFQDIQGDVYEMLLSEIATAGKMGQFRTPRHIIKLMAILIKPKLGDRIGDPACGTGGFLLGAYQYILTNVVRKKLPQNLIIDQDGFESGALSSLLTAKEKDKLEQSLIGFDIDITMVRLGLMNLMMHGIDNPNIDYNDTLSKSYNEDDAYDIILANPPFTGKIDKDDINTALQLTTSSTELLFLSRISKMLKVNGRAAVIIPEGVLFGSSLAQKTTREIILKDNRLDAVISLPQGAFKPYTGVKTAILVFTKTPKLEENKWSTEKVWFYSIESDGYTLDDNRRKLKINPLPTVKTAYENRKKDVKKDRKEYFYVTIGEIQSNNLDLSYNRYKEYEYTEQKYDPPKEILASLLAMEDEIIKEFKELNDLLG